MTNDNEQQPYVTTQGISDSGATISIMPSSTASRLQLPLHPFKQPINIRFGKEGSASISTHYVQGKGLLNQVAVVDDARMVLISTRDFVKQGLQVRYTDQLVTIYDPTSKSTLVTGEFNKRSKMWELPVDQLLAHTGAPPPRTTMQPVAFPDNVDTSELNEALAASSGYNESNKNLVDFVSTALCGLPDTSLLHVLENNYIANLSGGLTADQVRRNKPNSVATQKGHLKKIRKRLGKKLVKITEIPIAGHSVTQSDFEDDEELLFTHVDSEGWSHCVVEYPESKVLATTDEEYDFDSFCAMAGLNDASPESTDPEVHATEEEDDEDDLDDTALHFCGMFDFANATHDEIKASTGYADGTGALPTIDSDGSKLVMIYMHKGYVHVETIKDNTASEQCDALERSLNFFLARGQTISRQIMDNQAPANVLALLQNRKIPVELVPAGNHRYNRAEKGVDIFKNRFIATRAALDPQFPFDDEWQRLVPRIEVALNISIPCATDPKISAWHGINGIRYDWSRFPLALPGCKVLVHDSRDKRKSWDDHGTIGWCLEPSFKHYRGQRVSSFSGSQCVVQCQGDGAIVELSGLFHGTLLCEASLTC